MEDSTSVHDEMTSVEDEMMETDDKMSVESDTDLMDAFEQSINTFMEIEQLHTHILMKLDALSKDCNACDVTLLKKLHEDTMNHIRATGSTNFGEKLLH